MERSPISDGSRAVDERSEDSSMLALAKLLSSYSHRRMLHGELPKFSSSEPPGLYIHVPFCRSFCSFCPYVKTTYDPRVYKDYIDLLMKELALHDIAEFTSLYIGGGTPTSDADSLCKMVSRIRDRIQQEVAVEVHPLDASRDNLDLMRSSGIDFVSIGAQSFDNEMLRFLGRNHSAAQSLTAITNAINAGFEVVDVDLMFDLSDFPAEIIMSDFSQLLRLGPTQASVYPMMRFGGNNPKRIPHDWRAEAAVFEELEKIAQDSGYSRSSLWTFSASNTDKSYSSITRSFFLGLGAGAASYDGNIFSMNTASIRHYTKHVSNGIRPSRGHFQLNQFTSCLYYSFWSLYRGKLFHDEVRKLFPKAWKHVALILSLQKIAGNVERNRHETTLTTKGRRVFHKLEEWVTYRLIDPLWKGMKSENPSLQKLQET
ncbi:MAG: Coproporphyrinogen dehydrogenase [Thermotogales bacterium 46_20]|nr:MAG: Coproporphyrinogen dehydrogenase [Thermotogales bacterium 46_20]